MSVRIGIDLGTTRTVVAVADRGNYPVLPFAGLEGDDCFYIPSLSALGPEGLVHGFEAAEAARDGAALVRSLKRLLARPDSRWDTPVAFGPDQLPLGEVLTSYLTHVRDQVARALGVSNADLSGPTARTAVAVPAHAWSAQRMLTLDAFSRAGFHVTAMLNEPSAAGLEYTHRRSATLSSHRTRVLVYDLGGGTFDCSVVDVAGRRHEVLASRGLPVLGGDDIDLTLAQLAQERAGLGAEDLSGAQADALLDECRHVKEGIVPQTRRVVVDVAGREVVIATADLYDACRDLVARTVEMTSQVVASLDGRPGAGTQPLAQGGQGGTDLPGDVAGVYLVGGASSFPLVGRALRERYGRRVHRSPYPGASTAIGLAIAADPDSGVGLVDRLSRGFGVFREDEDGRRTSFDLILAPDAVAEASLNDSGAAAGQGGPQATVIEREYDAVHNVGRYQFVECSGVGDAGEPEGVVAPYAPVLLPLDEDSRQAEHEGRLGALTVRRLGHGPRVHERYEVDATGQVRVTLTDLSVGLSRTVTLGELGGSAAQPA